ncbi:MAG: NAD-dependent epimerase/dehydratase family protein [Gammaproteobacteria bacterium]
MGDPYYRKLTIADDLAAQAYYRNRRVLVVGADGFIGMNLVRALDQLGAEISIVTRRKVSDAASFAAHVFRGDMMDEGLADKAVKGQSVVFALAGVLSATLSNKDPEQSLKNDCLPNLRLFRACEREDEKPVVIFSSTRLVYGTPQYLPVDEAHPNVPQSAYAAHKLTMENYLRIMGQTSGMPYSVLRISNPYGPHQSLQSRGYGVINQFIRMAAMGEPISIFGEGKQKRDYIFIDDVINTLLMVAATKRCHGEIFNLGGSESLSIARAATQISELAESEAVKFVPWPEEYRAVETGDYITDLTKLNNHIDYRPQTEFSDGVLETLRYYRHVMADEAGSF